MTSCKNFLTWFCRLPVRLRLCLALQENASRPEGVPPSQGGKYVGFGSSPGPPSSAPRQQGDDVTAYLSKGFSQLSTAAGMFVNTTSLAILGHKLVYLNKEQTLVGLEAQACLSLQCLCSAPYAFLPMAVTAIAKPRGHRIYWTRMRTFK